jgi:hypothetical protein
MPFALVALVLVMLALACVFVVAFFVLRRWL